MMVHAPSPTQEHESQQGLVKSAVLSECRRYRYVLRRHWCEGEAMRFVMLNPSVADATIDDPTIRRCMGFARREGYGGIIVCNLFALRSTDPAALTTHADPKGPENDFWLGKLVERAAAIPVVAAWGSNAFAQRRANTVKAMFAQAGVPLWCLGKTKDGHPRHPLYVKGDQALLPLVSARKDATSTTSGQ